MILTHTCSRFLFVYMNHSSNHYHFWPHTNLSHSTPEPPCTLTPLSMWVSKIVWGCLWGKIFSNKERNNSLDCKFLKLENWTSSGEVVFRDGESSGILLGWPLFILFGSENNLQSLFSEPPKWRCCWNYSGFSQRAHTYSTFTYLIIHSYIYSFIHLANIHLVPVMS